MTHRCCRCGREGATHTSPSPRAEWYCDDCAVARCRRHTIEDFVYDAGIDYWVDPCVAPKETTEQGDLWKAKK